jgi:serine/threonine-protein kinase
MAESVGSPISVGRYILYGPIASGGMATVHFGRLRGPGGFARTVAIKRLHASLARDPEFVAMMLDEARLAARVRHPNVVPTLDVVADEHELLLVMEYVHGESLARLCRALVERKERVPLGIAVGIIVGVLHGLHAAHTATSDRGQPLYIIHRDVSPQNIMVGVDGHARVLDFGVAKASGRVQTTRRGQIKGKLAYMPPEQALGQPLDARVDTYAAAVILWEVLAGERLFARADGDSTLQAILQDAVVPPSAIRKDVPPGLDAIILQGLMRDPEARHPTARAFAIALEQAVSLPPPHEVGAWVEQIARGDLDRRTGALSVIEGSTPLPSGDPPQAGSQASIGAYEETRDAIPLAVEQSATPSLPPESSLRTQEMRPPTLAVGPSLAETVVAPPHQTPRSRRALVLAVAVAVGLILAVTYGMQSHDEARPPAPDPSMERAATVPTPAAPVLPPVDAASTAPTTRTPKENESAAPEPERSPNPARTGAAKHRVSARPKPNPCDPPFVVDASGVKIPKPQCR